MDFNYLVLNSINKVNLLEAKFRETPAQLIQQIKKVAVIYSQQYNSKNKDSIKKLKKEGKIATLNTLPYYEPYFNGFEEEKNYPKYFAPKMSTIVITDLKTQEKKRIRFLCIYGNNITDNYATFREDFSAVHLYDDNLKDLPVERIESIILHELTHGFQEYKDYSKKFTKMRQKGRFNLDVYHLEPIEFDSHLNEIAYLTSQKYKKLKEGIKKTQEQAAKYILEKRLETFLTELRVLIKSPPETYFKFKELTLPTHLIDFESFLKSISKRPDYWKKFKTKMINLYNQLV